MDARLASAVCDDVERETGSSSRRRSRGGSRGGKRTAAAAAWWCVSTRVFKRDVAAPRHQVRKSWRDGGRNRRPSSAPRGARRRQRPQYGLPRRFSDDERAALLLRLGGDRGLARASAVFWLLLLLLVVVVVLVVARVLKFLVVVVVAIVHRLHHRL